MRKRQNAGSYVFLKYFILHCFICRPSDSTVSEDAGIEPRTVTPSQRGKHTITVYCIAAVCKEPNQT